MDTIVTQVQDNSNEDAIKQAGEIIRCGGLVAFPTETVYGLGGDALNPESSKKIYGEEYEFGYDQFIQNSIEDKLASLYVFLIFMRDEIEFKKQKKFHFNFSDRIFILHKVVELCMKEQYSTAIAVVETLARSMNIDLSYYVDALLLNLMYKHKIGISHGSF